MGALVCRLLLPGGVFLLLLYLSSLRLLPDLPLSSCFFGGRPCRWSGNPVPDKEEQEGTFPAPHSAQTQEPQGQDHEFHTKQLLDAFNASITPQGEILIGKYLRGWKELIKFMDSLGAAFGLISHETWTKLAIMQQHQAGHHGAHYHTVQSMVTFELESGLVAFESLPVDRLPSGCRTLLRLHRALKWLELFLQKLGTSEEDGDPSKMCADAYQEALAPYHSWWVRQAASLAFMALPSRQELYHIICTAEEQKARAVLLVTVDAIIHVYNITQSVYADHGMLDLP